MTESVLQQYFWWIKLIFWTLNGVGMVSVLVSFEQTEFKESRNTVNTAFIFALVLSFLLGMLPIPWGSGGDREWYAEGFLRMQTATLDEVWESEEFGFSFINWFLGKYLTEEQYFIAIALIYVGNYFIAVRKLVQGDIYWLMLGIVLSLGFVSYNLNTMRAGLAISFLMLALSTYPSFWRMGIFMLIAYSIHHSMIIPSLMIAVSYFCNRTKYFYYLWILSVPVSFFAGNFFNEYFSDFSEDSRTKYLTTSDTYYNIGFRIDLVVFSVVPLLVGAYYIFKRGISDRFYHMIYNSYVLTNIFWILVIRSNFSDRFAYLSWFMIPLVLIYPLLKHDMDLHAGKWLGCILGGEILFRCLF
ncbi:MAG: EpsG family protein [Prevotellaceae bacterium]|nr:EpsG family protein [Prevotellaceae bacterium]